MSFCGNCANAAHRGLNQQRSEVTLAMDAQLEQAASEIKRIKACIINLISLQALPAIWR